MIKTRFYQLLLLAMSGVAVAGCGLAAVAPVSVTIKSAEGEEVVAATPSETPTGTETPTTTAPSGASGDLTGTVVFEGALPNLPPLVAAGSEVKDKEVCAAVEIPDESLLVNAESKGIGNVFIFLEKAPGGTKAADAEPVKFDQKGCRFFPHVLLCRTKTPVLILSDDPIAHNTHTFPQRGAQFNSGIPPNDRTGVPMSYTQPEKQPLEVKCDFHPWMRAFHLPLDHDFAAITDADGKFEIKGLPAGKHTFKVWHERGQLLERSLKITIPLKEPLKLSYASSKFGL